VGDRLSGRRISVPMVPAFPGMTLSRAAQMAKASDGSRPSADSHENRGCQTGMAAAFW